MNRLVLDSSAWIEYLHGTPKGAMIRTFVTTATIFLTGAIAAEVLVRIARAGASVADAEGMLSSIAAFAPFDLPLARDTAALYLEHRKKRPKFSLIDAHVLAAAKHYKAKAITCDNDFAGIPDAIVVR